MPTVDLIHPIWIMIVQFMASAQQQDTSAREPVHGARQGPTIKIQAQVKWDKRKQPSYGPGGPTQASTGYILVRHRDMARLGIHLKRGDKITQIGGGLNSAVQNIYLTGEEPMGHYPGSRGSQVSRFLFEARDPGRQP